MTWFRSDGAGRLALAAASLAAAMLIHAPGAHSQGSGMTLVRRGPVNASQCLSGSTYAGLNAPGSAGVSCTNGTMVMGGSAAFTPGAISSQTSISQGAATAPGATAWNEVEGSAQWTDRVTFYTGLGATIPAYARLTARFSIDVTLFQSQFPGGFESATGYGYAHATPIGGAPTVRSNNAYAFLQSDIGSPQQNSSSVDMFETLLIPVNVTVYGTGFDFSFNVGTNVWTRHLYDLDRPFSSASASMSAQVTGLDFLDNQQQQVSGVSYSFANGTEIAAVTATPEPASLVLIGTGLLALVGFKRSRHT